MSAYLPFARVRDRKKIRNIFGKDIHRILSRTDSLKRNGTTSFLIPSLQILDKCQLIMINNKEMSRYEPGKLIRPLSKKHIKMTADKRRRRQRQRERQRIKANKSRRIPCELSQNNPPEEFRQPLESEDKEAADPYLDLVPENIFKQTGKSTSEITHRRGVKFGLSTKSPHFPSDHPLESLDPTRLFKEIMCNCPSAQPCLPQLKPLLCEFIRNHKNFKYFHIINNFTADSNGQYPSELSENQLNRLFSMILFKVPPQGLFGHRGNLKRLRFGVLAHIKSPKRQFFLPELITNKLNLNTINWLQIIRDDKSKRSIINSMMSWFIKSYIITVLKTFLGSNRTPHNSKRIFFPITESRKQTDDFINNLLNQNVLEKTLYRKSNQIPVATMNLYLKPDGLRPMYQAFPTADEQKMLKTLSILLKQLNTNKYCSITAHDLHYFWKPFASRMKYSKIYYVTCDVTDAFGSISHEKLSSIIDELFDKLPDDIPYETFQCLTVRKTHYTIVENFTHASLPLTIPKGSLFYSKPRGAGNVPKQVIRGKLQEFINDQLVIINEACYRMRQGVGQGLSLSSLLSDIYYGKMVEEKFTDFQKLGTLVRYVDDYLYLTNDKVAAERFLDIANNGIVDYNCRFNGSKTHTNLPPNCEEKFEFLGYEFSTLNGEVLPIFSESPSQYNMHIGVVSADKEKQAFKRNMMAFGGLKLMKIILDPRINSKMTIDKAFKVITNYAAQRCFILCLHLLNPETLEAEFVFKVIHGMIDKLMSIYYRRVSRSREANRAMRLTVWKIFVDVLRKNSAIAQRVVPILQEKIHILKVKYEKCQKTV